MYVAAEAFNVVRTAERVLTDETEWRKHEAEMARRREMDREAREQASRATPPAGNPAMAARQRKTGRKERQNQNKRERESGA